MKKYITSLNIIFALEIAIVALASTGLIPREAILVWTGLAVFYLIFSPLKDGLWLIVASIPLFAALPISDNFDSMANWRILIAVLFLCLFFKKGVSLNLIKGADGRWRVKENLKHYALEYLSLVFLIISLISFSVADYQILAIKKFLYLVNIFLLFLIIRNLTRAKGDSRANASLLPKGGSRSNASLPPKETIIKIWQAAAVGGAAALFVALVQLIAVLFAPLYSFWQFWAGRVIPAFYGEKLGHLLSYSNTWFAYYKVNPPTLRLFSVFPDSHSFAMFLILTVPIFLGLAFFYQARQKKKIFFWLAAVLSLLSIVLSGSRGAWLSIAPTMAAAFYLWGQKKEQFLIKKALATFGLFIALFVLSVGYPPLFYKFQSWQTGQSASTTFSFFERVKSISDEEETSNKGRLEIWRSSVKSIAERPLLGVGLGNYVKVLDENISAVKKGASAHNLYLDFASEIGVLGAVILIAIFLNILYTSWLVWRRSNEPHFKLYGLLFGLYFLWVAGYSFFDVVLLNDKVFLFFMVGAATLYSLRGIYEYSEKQK